MQKFFEDLHIYGWIWYISYHHKDYEWFWWDRWKQANQIFIFVVEHYLISDYDIIKSRMYYVSFFIAYIRFFFSLFDGSISGFTPFNAYFIYLLYILYLLSANHSTTHIIINEHIAWHPLKNEDLIKIWTQLYRW